jgi:hypothetical protein
MLQSDYCVARVVEQRSHHRAEARDQYRRRGRQRYSGTGARQHDGRSTVQNTECNARPIRLLIITKPAQPGEHCLLGRRTNQSESFASKVSRNNRHLTTEGVTLGKDDAPALLPQLFNGNPFVSCGSEASTRSTVFARRAESTCGSDNSTSSTRTFGERAWNAARAAVSASPHISYRR